MKNLKKKDVFIHINCMQYYYLFNKTYCFYVENSEYKVQPF